jgi:branched-chain amino acid transport system substrate-binding protein
MKKIALAVLALLALGLAYTPARAAQDSGKDEIVIGMLLAMSGQGSSYGKWMSQGAQLAVEEINADGGVDGHKLRLEIGDHKNGQVKASTTELSRMISLYHVPAVLSSYSPPSLVAQSMAMEGNLVAINGGGWSPTLVGKQYLWNTRLTGDATAIATLKAAWADGVRKVCLIYPKQPGGIETAKSASEFWNSLGGQIVCEEKHDTDATNFSAQMAKIRLVHPDALMTFSYGKMLGIEIKQARDYGVTVPLYGIEFLPENVEVAGKAIEGYKFAIDEFNVNSDQPSTKKFVEAYRAKYHEDPEFYGANYYEATYILADSMKTLVKEGKPITGRNIDEVIRQTRTYPSVYGGTLTFNMNGTVKKPISVYEVKDGKRQLLKRISD